MPAEKKVTAGEVDEQDYKQLLKDREELQQLKAKGTVSVEEHAQKTKGLEAKLEEYERERASAHRAELRAEVRSYISGISEEMNQRHFDNIIERKKLGDLIESVMSSFSDAKVDEYRRDEVDGKVDFKSESKKRLHAAMQDKANEYRAIEQRYREQNITASFANAPNANTLSEDRRLLGDRSEKAYWSDEKRQQSGHTLREKAFNFILSEALKMPVNRPDGSSWLAPYKHKLDKIIAAQHFYEDALGRTERHWFSPGGWMFETLNSNTMRNKLAKMFLSEADETTTTAILGGTTISQLPLDASAAIISSIWPRLIALQIAATSGTMTSNNKRIYERRYPRTSTDPFRAGRHFFGAVDSDNLATLATTFTATTTGEVFNDEGTLVRASGHIPQDVYGIVGEVADANVTITVTGVNQNGDTTATAVATFLSTDPVNTIRKFEPVFPGDRFLDITSVVSVGWTDAAGNGEVGIFTQDPYVGHTAGSAAQKAKYKLDYTDLTESSYDIQTNLPLNAIEDMQIAMAAGGGDAIDLVAQMIQIMGEDVPTYLDSKCFDKGIQGTFSGNALTFNANTPDPGYSDAKWKERLHFNMDLLISRVLMNGGAKPNWLVWSEADRPYFNEWLTNTGLLSKLSPEANDPFANSRAQFNIGGASVYVSENMPVEYIFGGSNNARTGVHYYVYVPFKILQALNATAGMETVVMLHHRAALDVVNGRGVGTLKVNRR